MFGIQAFVVALLLLGGAVAPSEAWLIALVVLTGVAAFRLRPWSPFDLRPALDVRMAAFVLAVLLLGGVVDGTTDWLIALAAVTGVAAFMPRLVALDGNDRGEHRARRHMRRRMHGRPDWRRTDGDTWS